MALVTEKTGPDVAGRRRAAARKQPVAGVPRVVVIEPGRPARRRRLARLRRRPADLPDLCGAVGERRQRPGAGAGAGWCATSGRAAARRPAPCCGTTRRAARAGSSARSIAFAPDGQSLFLSSRRAPALHARAGPEPTARQDPAPDARRQAGAGQSEAGQTGAATVTITDPPEDTEAAEACSRGASFTWPGPNLTPAETWSTGHRNPYGLAFDAGRPAVGD